MESVHQFQLTKIIIKKGDITKENVAAIVNAANSGLLGGLNIDNAIHRAGGLAIFEECKLIKETQGRCPTGEAVITTGGNLPAKFVIHAVGPVWRGGDFQEDKMLEKTYLNSMRLAQENGVKTIAFSPISVGPYGYPVERAAQIAFKAIKEFILKNSFPIEELRFVLHDEEDYHAYVGNLHCA